MQAAASNTTPTPTPIAHLDRAQIERTVEKMLAAVDRLVAMLDTIDPDPDLEEGADLEAVCEDEGAQCEDEGGACEDEGFDSDSEPGEGESGWFDARLNMACAAPHWSVLPRVMRASEMIRTGDREGA